MVVFNGKNFMDFGAYTDHSKVFEKPELDYTVVSIAGKSGDVRISNKRFNNLDISIPCFIRKDFVENFTGLANFLLQDGEYHRLETDAQPDRYRMAAVKSLPPTTGAWLKSGKFTVTFNAKPQVFLKSGDEETTFTRSGSIWNNTLQASKPFLRVYGSGVLGIGDYSMTISTTYPYLDIDCEIMDAQYNGNNANSMITLSDFPVLEPGANGVSLGSGITRVIIKPRWWEI